MMKRLLIVVLVLVLPFVLFSQNQREAIFYTVQKRDNLFRIAKNKNVPSDSLYRWNNLTEKSTIRIGQKIIVGWKDVPSEEVSSDSAIPEQSNKQPVVSESSVVEQSQGKAGTSDNKKYRKERGEAPNPQEPKNNFFSWGTFSLGILLGTVLGLLFLYLFYVRKLKDGYGHNERDLLQRIAELRDEKTKLNSELIRLQSKIQSIEKEKQQFLDENVALGEEIDRLKSIGQEANDNRVKKVEVVSPQTPSSSTALYADAIIDDYFVKVHETSDEDSVFVLQLNGEDSASFSVCESARQRVLANPSYLEGCEKQILGNTMQLEIVSKGIAQKNASNGKWKVINKLNVIIR